MNLLFLNTRGCIMKKLAIVAVALVLAMAFTGCQVASLLAGSSWRQDWGAGCSDLSFKADGSCTYESFVGGVLATSGTGTWTADGNEVTIAETSIMVNGIWAVEIKKDELTLTYVDKTSSSDRHVTGDVELMTRVTDDAE
jgi:hypothetical protein